MCPCVLEDPVTLLAGSPDLRAAEWFACDVKSEPGSSIVIDGLKTEASLEQSAKRHRVR